MLIYQITIVLMSLVIFLNLYINHRSKKMTKANSQVFHPQFNEIWKRAAIDWAENPDDERNFEDFLTDTIDIIFKGSRAQ